MFNLLSMRGAPIFATFFLWSLGTGAVQLARPLFAFSLGAPILLVTLVTASNSVAHLVAGPITGFAMDRWGRRPLLIMGLAIRAASGFAQFFVATYPEFLVLEFFGGLGVAMWGTGSTVLLADLSVAENRGRVVAARSFASRLGAVVGPLVGAAVATAMGLRWVFVFNGLTKIADIAIVLFVIRESRPETGGSPSRERAGRIEVLRSMFANRAFLVIALVAFALSVMTQGVFSALFPIYLQSERGFATADVGNLMTVAGLATVVVLFPNGYLVDRYGRKSTLVPGLAVIGLSSFLLAVGVDYAGMLLMVVVYGVGEGMCFGASQAYAMDLAPQERRGAFLGIWSLLNSSGSVVAPLLIGLATQQFGFATAFTMLALAFAVVAAVTWAVGPNTGTRARVRSTGEPGTPAQRPSPTAVGETR